MTSAIDTPGDFFNTDEHAEAATYDGGPGTIDVIFSNEYYQDGIATPGMEGKSIFALCLTADIDADPVGKTLVVDSVTYDIVNHQPDGTGMTRLVLRTQ